MFAMQNQRHPCWNVGFAMQNHLPQHTGSTFCHAKYASPNYPMTILVCKIRITQLPDDHFGVQNAHPVCHNVSCAHANALSRRWGAVCARAKSLSGDTGCTFCHAKRSSPNYLMYILHAESMITQLPDAYFACKNHFRHVRMSVVHVQNCFSHVGQKIFRYQIVIQKIPTSGKKQKISRKNGSLPRK